MFQIFENARTPVFLPFFTEEDAEDQIRGLAGRGSFHVEEIGCPPMEDGLEQFIYGFLSRGSETCNVGDCSEISDDLISEHFDDVILSEHPCHASAFHECAEFFRDNWSLLEKAYRVLPSTGAPDDLSDDRPTMVTAGQAFWDARNGDDSDFGVTDVGCKLNAAAEIYPPCVLYVEDSHICYRT